MKRNPKTTDVPASDQQQPVQGPRPLDPAELKHVGGGAPKGTWEIESVKPLSTDTNPKTVNH